MAFIFAFSTSGLSATHTSRFVRPILLWLFPDISEERIAVVHIIVRKISHFSSYAVLGLLAARAFLGSAVRTLREHWFAAGVLLVIGYALLD
jgi:VanZ family protein